MTRLLLIVISLLLALSAVHALPFSKSSGVQELDGKQLTAALKTHKPVFLLLYAPWCGHCKAIHPEYEKLAKSVDGVVEVIAVDADKHREVGGQYNLKGFPTVVYYGSDKKKWKPYNGERKAGAMTSAALGLVEAAHAVVLKDEAHLEKAFKSVDGAKYVAALFTEKDKVPPLVQVLAYDPTFKGVVPFVVIKKKNSLTEKFSPEKFPSIAVLETVEGETKVKAWFTEKIKYDAIRAFVASTVGIEEKKGAGSASKPKEAPKPATPKPALPVQAVEFTAGQMKLFCGADAPLKKGTQPFCAVFFVNAEDVERVQEIYKQFSNDPFVIMYSSDAATLTKLGMSDSTTMNTLVVFKGGKKGVRFASESFGSVTDMMSQGGKLLESIAGGEKKMSKLGELPKL